MDQYSLNAAFQTRLRMLHDYISPDLEKFTSIKKKKKPEIKNSIYREINGNIFEIVMDCKKSNKNIINTLKENEIKIIEVEI